MNIRKFVLPDFDLKHFLGIAVQISPYSEGSFSVSENDVEETDNSVGFTLLLPFLFHIILFNFLREALKVESKVVLHCPGNNVCSDDIL